MTSTETTKSALPATTVADEFIGEIHENPQVGDLVVTYTRGYNRLAKITKVGPKRVTVEYTTQGAWDQARKIHESHLAIDIEAQARIAAEQAAKNYDFTVQEANPATAKYAVAESWKTEETAAAERAKHQAEIDAETREQHIERIASESRERNTKFRNLAREGGVDQYVHVTKKNCKREEIFVLLAPVATS